MDLEQNGFTIVRGVLSADECKTIAEQVLDALQRDQRSTIHAGNSRTANRGIVGGRNLLALWGGWRRLIQSPQVADLIANELGDRAGLVRGLFFDKPPGQGWSLAMHRDWTIAVAQHQNPPAPFAKPTHKSGVPHVEATPELLASMITLRLHLDPMGDCNGPLVVIPGSHRHLESQCSAEAVTIHCEAGDLFVMRPLLIHGSRACDPNTTQHRRVIHLEIAPSDELPGKYRWHQFERCLNVTARNASEERS
jgi:ectoine hydroxylase-related dioxygenase (phytanoyl-CoA dioxygenase family)